jgi:hypothetical protein
MSKTLHRHLRAAKFLVGVVVLLAIAHQALSSGTLSGTLSVSDIPALAAATVSQATANAIGGNLITTGACDASNDGTVGAPGTLTSSGSGCTTGGTSSNSGSALSASVIVQTSNADPNGTSAACAGATGPGGAALQVGPAGPCTGLSAGTSAGVNVLGGLVTADAVYSTCIVATPGGTPTGGSTLASAGLAGATGLLSALNALGLGSLTGGATLPVNPGANTMVTLALGTTDILKLVLNEQSTVGGKLTVTALDLTLLGSGVAAIENVPVIGPLLLDVLGLTGTTLTGALASGIHLTIGTVTCGPDTTPAATTTTTTAAATTTTTAAASTTTTTAAGATTTTTAAGATTTTTTAAGATTTTTTAPAATTTTTTAAGATTTTTAAAAATTSTTAAKAAALAATGDNTRGPLDLAFGMIFAGLLALAASWRKRRYD